MWPSRPTQPGNLASGKRDSDYALTLGVEPGDATVHGSGWNAYIGPGASHLVDSDDLNPIRPALAVLLAIARLFGRPMAPMGGPFLFNGSPGEVNLLPLSAFRSSIRHLIWGISGPWASVP